MKAAALKGSRSMVLSDLPRDVKLRVAYSEVVPVNETPDAFARLSAGRAGISKILVPPDA